MSDLDGERGKEGERGEREREKEREGGEIGRKRKRERVSSIFTV